MARIAELIEKIAPTRTTVLITGESGTGKERVARLLHERSDRAQAAVRGRQLRRLAGGAHGERAVRPREGRVHRRRRAIAGPLPRGGGRHAPPRRGGRAAGVAPGEAAARPPGAEGALGRRRGRGRRGRARARRHQPGRRGRRAAEQVPAGSLLPAQRHPAGAAPAPRSGGRREPPRRALRGALRGGARQGRARPHRRRAAGARCVRVPGQRARAGEHDGARRGAGVRPRDRPRRSAGRGRRGSRRARPPSSPSSRRRAACSTTSSTRWSAASSSRR